MNAGNAIDRALKSAAKASAVHADRRRARELTWDEAMDALHQGCVDLQAGLDDERRYNPLRLRAPPGGKANSRRPSAIPCGPVRSPDRRQSEMRHIHQISGSRTYARCAVFCRSAAPNRGGRGEERQWLLRATSEGEGWLFFAFVILVIVGFFNVVLGLTMIAGDNIYVTARDSGTVVIGNVNGWGWVIGILGVLEVLAGFGVLARSQLSRWFAIFMATLAALGHLPVIFGPHPIYSFLVVLMSVLVIYGLAEYGGRDRIAA